MEIHSTVISKKIFLVQKNFLGYHFL